MRIFAQIKWSKKFSNVMDTWNRKNEPLFSARVLLFLKTELTIPTKFVYDDSPS